MLTDWLVDAALVLLAVVAVVVGVVAIIINSRNMAAIRKKYCNTKTLDKRRRDVGSEWIEYDSAGYPHKRPAPLGTCDSQQSDQPHVKSPDCLNSREQPQGEASREKGVIVNRKFYPLPAQIEGGEKPPLGAGVRDNNEYYKQLLGEPSSPPATAGTAREQAEKELDAIFRLRLQRKGHFYANKTLRADMWREIAVTEREARERAERERDHYKRYFCEKHNPLEDSPEDGGGCCLECACERAEKALRELQEKMSHIQKWGHGSYGCHVAPDRTAIEVNNGKEPEGERIRAELEEFLTRNDIVGIMLDTEQHVVRVDIAKLPPNIKSVLTLWGSIFVKDEDEELSSLKSSEGAK